MELPGKKLREARESLRLKYRDVEQASQKIASIRANPEFAVGLSRLADIENKGTLPTVYRLYSLCVIYRLDFASVLRWYGIILDDLASDAAQLTLSETHPVRFEAANFSPVMVPIGMHPEFDPAKTSFISRQVQQWGRVPIAMLAGADVKKHRYAYIGADDWFMYPILVPGSFVQIDESRRRVSKEGWANEHERPIYLVEHHQGHTCAWCTERGGLLILQPHPCSKEAPRIYKAPEEAEVVGQVVAVAMRLDQVKRRHIHS